MAKSDEQVNQTEVQEEQKSATEQVQDESKSATKKSDTSTSKEQENERLRGQVSALQKKMDEQSQQFERLMGAFKEGNSEDKKLEIEDVLAEVQNLKTEIQTKNQELEKNSYIDGLEVSEARKKALKNLVKAENYKEEVEKMNASLEEVFTSESSGRISDTRPKSGGASSPSNWGDAKEILENPDKFKRAKGLI